jgi:hypothetical protein
MIWNWLTERRRKAILHTPFPDSWTEHLRSNMAHFAELDDGEQAQLRDLVQIFVAEKHWEGCGGLELTEEMQVTIAGQACLLVLGLEHVLYSNVETILVYPSTVVPKRVEDPYFARPTVVSSVMPLLGEAHRRGPVILTWDAVRRGGRHPERGHNVVYHEFAHKLDMLDGAVDGVPPIADAERYDEWVAVCTDVYERLHDRLERGLPSLLDPYAATDVAEFFAVVTETFFDRPTELEAELPELYDVLSHFYRQDPAARARRRLP